MDGRQERGEHVQRPFEKKQQSPLRLIVGVPRFRPRIHQLPTQIPDRGQPRDTRLGTGVHQPEGVGATGQVECAPLTEPPGENGHGRGGQHQSRSSSKRARGQRVERIVDGAGAGQLHDLEGVDESEQDEEHRDPSIALTDQAEKGTLEEVLLARLGDRGRHHPGREAEGDVTGNNKKRGDPA